MTAVNVASSSTSCVNALYRPVDNPLGGASLEIINNTMDKLEVSTTTLDQYLKDHPHIKPINFIKCDVEGHEYDAFKGAEATLKNDRPILLFECQDFRHPDGQVQRVFKLLIDMGYRGYFHDGNDLKSISEYDVSTYQNRENGHYVDNFFFLPSL